MDAPTEVEWRILLAIITIVMTILLNAYLFFKIAQAAGGVTLIVRGPRGVRLLTIISLMVGDVIGALFSQVVRLNYLLSGNGSCWTVNASTVYLMYLLPFVYGVGLVVLAVEGMIFRLQDQVNSCPKLSVLASSLPWILGVSIVLPMTLKDSDFHSCGMGHHENRTKLLFMICQILPVAVSMFVTTVCLSVMWNNDRTNAAPIYQQIRIQGFSVVPRVLDATTTDKLHLNNREKESDVGDSLVEEPLYLPVEIHLDTKESSSVVPSSTDHGPLEGGSSVDPDHPQRLSIVLTHKRRSADSENHRHSSHNFQTVLRSSESASTSYTAEGKYLSLTSLTPSTSPYLTKYEKSAMLLATVFFVVFTLPSAVINQLIPVGNGSTSTFSFSEKRTLKDFGYWMLSVRSFVSPFVWLVTRNITGP